ncbi:MAG: quinol:cytochrome C oxidoreductase [Flavobacteriales bacterium]|nr:quinol:cytochrome C oxidoreductase [Flavobacteriales bacterium]
MVSIILLVAGLVLSAIGIFQIKGSHDHPNPQTHVESAVPGDTHGEHTVTMQHEEHVKPWTARVWANMLVNSYYFLLFGVGALFFVALNYAANAGWSILVKRVAEGISAYIPIGLILLMIALIFGGSQLYHWLHYEHQALKDGAEGFDKILEGKSGFLNSKFLFLGVPLFVLIWYTFRIILRRLSLKEDEEGGTRIFLLSEKLSAAFLVIFGFSFSIIAWLVIMSVDAHWYSTIFAVNNFAVLFVTSTTIIVFFTLYLKSKGYLELVSEEILHDLGKFMFAFCIFWAYTWLAQFLLIWYANIHEEVVYYHIRLHGYFRPIFFINLFMNFFIPLILLMTRNAKRKPMSLIIAGSIILVGHWIDIFLMIMPGTVGTGAGIGPLEIGMPMAFAGLFIYVALNAISKANMYAINHPYIMESATYDVGP